jgi:hypothetical protein
MPHVIHYCHNYMLGKWFIGKYRLRKDFVSCAAPLLKEPPSDLALRYKFSIAPDGTRKTYKDYQPQELTFMVCHLIRALNDAATHFKDNQCNGTANYEKTYIFHDNMTLEEDRLLPTSK